MEAVFNIICFTLSVAVVAAAACAIVRTTSIKRDLQENEALLLFRKAKADGTEKKASPSPQTQELKGLASRLNDAGIALNPTGWRITQLGSALVAAVLVLALSGASSSGITPMGVAMAIAVAVVVVLGFKGFLKSRAKKQVLLLEKQLAQIEMQIAENSRSGLSVSRSVLACVELADEPLKGHLRRLYNEMTYSDTTLAEGFVNMARRTGSADVRLLANVVTVQQQTGSNLADALDFLHETISRRLEMRQSLQSSLAETKITRTIVAVTPWVIFALLAFAPIISIDGFWEFYSSNPIGWAVLGGSAAVEAGILVLISRMSNLPLD